MGDLVTWVGYAVIASVALWVAFAVGYIAGIDQERGRAKR